MLVNPGLSLLRSSAIAFAMTISIICLAAPPARTSHAAALAPESGGEFISTFAEDGITPQTIFNLGDTVVARAGSFPYPLSSGSRVRRFFWCAPDFRLLDQSNIKFDPQDDTLVIPTSGTFAKVGTWTVRTVNASGEGYAVAKFVVRRRLFPFIDLRTTKTGPSEVAPGDGVEYELWVTNPGPDDAGQIEFTDDVPTNMLFVAIRQTAGPEFECKTPEPGQSGQVTCSAKGLPLDGTAVFTLFYRVDPNAREGETCLGTTQVSSTTEELNRRDNVFYVESVVTRPAN